MANPQLGFNVHGELDDFLKNLLFSINPGIASMKASFSFINRDYDIEDMPNAGLLTNVRGEVKFESVCFGAPRSAWRTVGENPTQTKSSQQFGTDHYVA
ncbi:hypothetical protein [Wolbachia endosymbiont (group A) of Barypeithes pellucidus]|uniref:hypothetical protein n=1 Tax=Wolbachia endosymbiont (group A) of Barypeithes pellucidus TaxID=3139322 RepID=UPI003CCAB2FE